MHASLGVNFFVAYVGLSGVVLALLCIVAFG